MPKKKSKKLQKKMCMLEDNKICDNCLECNTCELDPKKICDNCAKCIKSLDDDFIPIDFDDLVIIEDLKKKFKIIEKINDKPL